MTESEFRYTVVTAFSATRAGGNPAAIVFLDSELPVQAYQEIARNLCQPVTIFIWVEDGHSGFRSFHARFYTQRGIEIPICGHATLASGGAVADAARSVGEEMRKIVHYTKTTEPLTIQRCEDGSWEMTLPTSLTTEGSQQERDRLIPIFEEALGRSLRVKYIGAGREGFETYLMIVIDEQDDLAGCVVNAEPLRATGYRVHTFTASSSTGKEVFVSRMFAPAELLGGEDHVCGSAHCVMAPYWYKEKGIPLGETIIARQVSQRGGELKITVQEDRKMRVGGQVRLLAKGTLHVTIPN
ncbi:Diaminopimelate epimerase-like protein [Pluteus cervinus]|uniref:Diaminopimelate epimerase-like protein n=1 Tax=Pluteus cervinus TaxID=181527 RepID=A0ACD3BIG1_9AGAR|nr:Diaminopimelate epimerase-like protein [Pluteus cervinus]